MWAHEFYSLQKSRANQHRTVPPPDRPTISLDTVRKLRSAMSQFETLSLLVTEPGRIVADQHQVWINDCRLTDSYSLALFMTGMGSRIGSNSSPSIALLDRHVRWLDNDLNRRFLMSGSDSTSRWDLALAGFANLILWLGWLRSGETFGLTWNTIEAIQPQDGPSVDLPANVGALLLRLQPETKSSRLRTADVILAYKTASGLSVGKWFHRARREQFRVDRDRSLPIFRVRSGRPWTSHYFRHKFLYPALEDQRQNGDPFLSAFDGSPGNTIPEKYWALHSYRRGSRTSSQRSNPLCRRKASDAEVYEHARWRRRRAGEATDVLYREWTVRDRVKLTLFCM